MKTIFGWCFWTSSSASRHFPVVYCLDGQNLFDPARSFAGVAWRLDLAADFHEQSGGAPFIAIAIDNGSTKGVSSFSNARTSREALVYFSKSGGITTASGQAFNALNIGIALVTPYIRAT